LTGQWDGHVQVVEVPYGSFGVGLSVVVGAVKPPLTGWFSVGRPGS